MSNSEGGLQNIPLHRIFGISKIDPLKNFGQIGFSKKFSNPLFYPFWENIHLTYALVLYLHIQPL